MADSPADDIKEMSFEAALRELETIVGKLKAAEMRIEKITLRNGQPTGTEPLDPQ